MGFREPLCKERKAHRLTVVVARQCQSWRAGFFLLGFGDVTFAVDASKEGVGDGRSVVCGPCALVRLAPDGRPPLVRLVPLELAGQRQQTRVEAPHVARGEDVRAVYALRTVCFAELVHGEVVVDGLSVQRRLGVGRGSCSTPRGEGNPLVPPA